MRRTPIPAPSTNGGLTETFGVRCTVRIVLNVRSVRLAVCTGLVGLLAACGGHTETSSDLHAISGDGTKTTTTTEAGESTTTTEPVSTSTTAAATATTGAPSTTTTVPAARAAEEAWPADGPDVLTFVDAPQPPRGTRETWRDEHGNLSPYVKRVRYVEPNFKALLAAFDKAAADGDHVIRLRLFRDVLVQIRDVDDVGISRSEPPPYTTEEGEHYSADLYVDDGFRTYVTLFWSETTRQDGYHSEYLHVRAGDWIEIDLVGDALAIYELDEDRPSYDD